MAINYSCNESNKWTKPVVSRTVDETIYAYDLNGFNYLKIANVSSDSKIAWICHPHKTDT